MSTVIRATTAKSSKWHIEKHRYLELKHFCLQYPQWLLELSRCDLRARVGVMQVKGTCVYDDKMIDVVNERMRLDAKIELVRSTCEMTDTALAPYLLEAVTRELSYSQLVARYSIPYGRQLYYERYRKFYWLLDKRLEIIFSRDLQLL